MQWNDRLVSIIVLCYQNQSQLRPTLESVLKQNYARLEIILTDDSSDTFDTQVWTEWINTRKRENIENVIVRRNNINLGTVRNLQKALEVMNGDYYMTISSGDIFSTNNAVSVLMLYAAHNNHEELIVMGKAVHCDENYQIKNDILPASDYAVLKERNAKALFRRLIYRCCVTAISSLHRKDFVEVVDGYDTAYRYYEDYPTYLRMARKGFTPLFVDKVITLHSMNGIANNADSVDIKIVKGFHHDREVLYQKDLKPYLHGQPQSVIKRLTIRREALQNQYLWTLWKKNTNGQNAILLLQHPWLLFFSLPKGEKAIQRIFRSGIWCLVLLSLLKSSQILNGTFDMLSEYILLLGCIIGFIAFTIYRVVVFLTEIRNSWRKAVTENN